MEKITAIIIDDEPSCTETMALELELYCPQVEILALCNTAEKGLSEIASKKPDLVFLDIEMPWMNGFELLETLDVVDFEVVFVTAYDQFALKAFNFSAVDYLLKPIKKEKLIKAVKKIADRRSKQIAAEKINAMLSNIRFLNNDFPSIAVPTSDGLEFIPVEEIIYCESRSNYSIIHKIGDQKLMLSKTLKDLQELLDQHHFFRIHQSHLINLKHLRKYHKGIGGSVVMSNGHELAVSKAKKSEFLKIL